MMTIADAAKIWPGGYGENLRDIIAEKSGNQPQAESFDKLDEIVDKVLEKLRKK
jgi:hypothetical protein